MKTWNKLSVFCVTSAFALSVNAVGITNVLDGMFTNVTAPNVVSNQFRGTINGGGVYVRSPISTIQLMSIDPPRFSAGCGGIDLYLGSFSFITADKLTQFLRQVAQSAAPLAFKMALDANFPQLGGVLDKFQHMAQMMNDSQRNSCQMARGLIDGMKNPQETLNAMTNSVSTAFSTAKGWFDDFTSSTTDAQTDASKTVQKARQEKNPDGTQVISTFGNVVWNALNAREANGFIFGITDDPVMAKQVIMSMMGTQVVKEGDTSSAQPKSVPFLHRTQLKSIFQPTIGEDGLKHIPIWSCNSDLVDCLNPTPDSFKTSGVSGFVHAKMFGADDATSPQTGSIVWNLLNCNSANCGMTASQLQFLNAIAKVPAVGILMRAQAAPGVVDMIVPELVDAMVDEISVAYGRAVIDIAVTTYSSTDVPKPEDYISVLKSMKADLAEAEASTKKSIERLNKMTAYIDSAIRANGSVLRYRPR